MTNERRTRQGVRAISGSSICERVSLRNVSDEKATWKSVGTKTDTAGRLLDGQEKKLLALVGAVTIPGAATALDLESCVHGALLWLTGDHFLTPLSQLE